MLCLRYEKGHDREAEFLQLHRNNINHNYNQYYIQLEKYFH